MRKDKLKTAATKVFKELNSEGEAPRKRIVTLSLEEGPYLALQKEHGRKALKSLAN